MPDEATQAEVTARLGRPFEQVRAQLIELFGQEWDEIEVVIETSAEKRGRTRADVIVDLVGKASERPAAPSRIRRSLIRWIGKPWRERPNPWDRFKDRLPPVPPPVVREADDLDEWTPLRPDED
ncbi:MAG: hypothetical protein ACRDKJ_04810 [Actinomycetota bacterium]